MLASELIEFEREVACAFKCKRIRGPIHLAGGNEVELIEIFREIKEDDWVLSTWRSTYHALLKGVPRALVMDEILKGKSMMLHFPKYRFMTSAIVAGMCSIACGLAAGGEKVWCFVGDMAGTTGNFHDAAQFNKSERLKFIIEDNGFSTNTPTIAAWGGNLNSKWDRYEYMRTTEHCGTDEYVSF